MSRTVGVEEEFLLVARSGPGAGQPEGGRAEDVVRAAESIDGDGQFEHEFMQEQIETASAPAAQLDDLGADLRTLRSDLVQAGAARNARVLAAGTFALPCSPTTTDEERYLRMRERFGLIAREQLTCGMHVHVGIASLAEAVGVIDRLRVWLAPVLALSANSPFFQGHDTGYASYRSVMWGRWPTAGPTEVFGTVDEYDRVRSMLISSGAALDDGMIYFDARPSARYPTVEVRVADVCARVDDAVAIAALIRALVVRCADHWAAGEPPPAVRTEVLRAAAWRAARGAMDGDLVDAGGAIGEPAALVPAWDLVDALVEQLTPDLRSAGDLDLVHAGLSRIRQRGTGAAVQRRAAEDGGPRAAMDVVALR